MEKYVCTICGYIYDPAVGDPDNDIAPGTAFADLPEEWVCPLCGADKTNFTAEWEDFFTMQLSWCTLTVAKLEKSLAFYEGVLGLHIHRRFRPTPNIEIAFLGGTTHEQNSAEIELIANSSAANQLAQLAGRGTGISIGLTVSSLDEIIENLHKHGIAIDEGPIQPSPQIRFIFIKDPDGYTVQLAEHLSA